MMSLWEKRIISNSAQWAYLPSLYAGKSYWKFFSIIVRFIFFFLLLELCCVLLLFDHFDYTCTLYCTRVVLFKRTPWRRYFIKKKWIFSRLIWVCMFSGACRSITISMSELIKFLQKGLFCWMSFYQNSKYIR